MAGLPQLMLHPDSGNLLRLLCNLRWLGIVGQAVVVWLAGGPMQLALPPVPLWSGIVALVIFNLVEGWRIRRASHHGEGVVFVHLLADIAALTWMVGWSGGLENPFSTLFLMPIALSILALRSRWVWLVAAASVGGYATAALLAQPLAHAHGGAAADFNLHKAGMLASFAVSVTVVLAFFTRVAAAWRHSERKVAGLQERFARNEGIVALATHAASVAHELNTPLATMTLMVDDLIVDASGPLREEMVTLRMLLESCRDRVRELAGPADASGSRRGTGADLERTIERWLLVRPGVALHRTGAVPSYQPVDLAVTHLLQALLNNAADASAQRDDARVDLHIESKGSGLRVSIRDYGPGLAAAEPLLPGTLFRTSKPDGLGIGLALSHATVERLGGALSMQTPPDGPGVVVTFDLPVSMAA